jgi:3-oxoacyl-[acyl-carrier protein] reductase
LAFHQRNSTAIPALVRFLADSDDALFDGPVAVNLKGAFNALREASLRLRNGERIVNFSTSVVARAWFSTIAGGQIEAVPHGR